MRRILTLMLVLGLAVACAVEKTKPEESPQAAAKAFLALIDQDNYQESWREASGWLRNKVDAIKWAEHAGRIRRPLGVVSHRTVRSVELEDALEDMPEGNFAFVSFDTILEDNSSASEMVGLMLEVDSTWRVIGYQTL